MYGCPGAKSRLGGPVDLAVDTPQEEFCQACTGQVATGEWFGIDYILEDLSRQTRWGNHRFKKPPYPNRVFVLEVVVELLKESSCTTIRADLDELDAKLKGYMSGGLEGRTQTMYLGKRCPRFVQSSSDLDDGTLGIISCLSPASIRFNWHRRNVNDSLGRPSVMTR